MEILIEIEILADNYPIIVPFVWENKDISCPKNNWIELLQP